MHAAWAAWKHAPCVRTSPPARPLTHLLGHQPLQQLHHVRAQPRRRLQRLRGPGTGVARLTKKHREQNTLETGVQGADTAMQGRAMARRRTTVPGTPAGSGVCLCLVTKPQGALGQSARPVAPVSAARPPAHLDDCAHEHARQRGQPLHGADGSQHHLRAGEGEGAAGGGGSRGRADIHEYSNSEGVGAREREQGEGVGGVRREQAGSRGPQVGLTDVTMNVAVTYMCTGRLGPNPGVPASPAVGICRVSVGPDPPTPSATAKRKHKHNKTRSTAPDDQCGCSTAGRLHARRGWR